MELFILVNEPKLGEYTLIWKQPQAGFGTVRTDLLTWTYCHTVWPIRTDLLVREIHIL